ncbi:Pre-mRNA cleavage complex 2 protein Pcf11 [Pseudolycoriella hygida]|uniref:Pre-mRNA cleavage complex 2 protein Pcf11 n=1 Tax=Pseudolycoriella hygida TaxID=35572 RepID=A0A9Q0S9C2_9DIPT|nr:Pre-mRNA cleavage complex 2 protein Pcf11 [Pseudolycoriella hygida]
MPELINQNGKPSNLYLKNRACKSSIITDLSKLISKVKSCNKTEIEKISVYAKERVEYAGLIAKCILNNGAKSIANLYVIDSIIKNVRGVYITLFSDRSMIRRFSETFESAESNIRLKMFTLRHSWNGVFSPRLLNEIDREISKSDSNWPVMEFEKIYSYSVSIHQ